MDLQLVSQCGSTSNCLCRSVREIHWHVAGTLSNQPTNKQSCRLRWTSLRLGTRRCTLGGTGEWGEWRGGGGGGEGDPHGGRAPFLLLSVMVVYPCYDGCIVPCFVRSLFVGWLVGCLTSQQQASVSQGRICSDNLTCCHTEIQVADPTFYLIQSQYTDTGPTSPSADPYNTRCLAG